MYSGHREQLDDDEHNKMFHKPEHGVLCHLLYVRPRGFASQILPGTSTQVSHHDLNLQDNDMNIMDQYSLYWPMIDMVLDGNRLRNRKRQLRLIICSALYSCHVRFKTSYIARKEGPNQNICPFSTEAVFDPAYSTNQSKNKDIC